jgi:hypothetical protein
VERAFQEAFAELFTSMIIHQDPNNKLNRSNPVPYWPPWYPGQIEMLFNKTSSGLPNIDLSETSVFLTGRCP